MIRTFVLKNYHYRTDIAPDKKHWLVSLPRRSPRTLPVPYLLPLAARPHSLAETRKGVLEASHKSKKLFLSQKEVLIDISVTHVCMHPSRHQVNANQCTTSR
ncbi:hypothetical protein CPB84DRAFT_648419 [Gymnopilus junonius]|uniref:Uncharacterized protein n=1 Tax=Gymnopilus junonius TaxID=109634 RepID=A0A9P5TGE7_GYMJU|nr:hypothetical protein CPB84DRAFT_648419 [Gymnopilus junonius]